MRPLDETETSVVFEKLFKFVGNNLKNLVENPSHEGPESNPGRYCFRLNKNKIYYCSESLVKRATNIARPNLISLGTCIGKYTHGGNFHLTVQALNLLAANAKHKISNLVLEEEDEDGEEEEKEMVEVVEEKEIVVVEEPAVRVQKRTGLRTGSEGEAVRELQEALQKLGFYSGEEDMESSSFSCGTERAVKTWQSSLGS